MEREALKLALEALEDLPGFRADIDNAITAIKEALAQLAQEPVAYVTGTYGGRFTYAPLNPAMVLPVGMALYAMPPKREWVGLMDEEIRKIHTASFGKDIGFATGLTEAKLKEKNT